MQKFKIDDLPIRYRTEIQSQLGHAAYYSFGEPLPAVMERYLRDGPLAKGKAQTTNTGRFLVRVTSFRRRLLDEDNLCEKYFVDCCRYAGLLPADSPDQCKIETTQEKVSLKEEERTVITISKL